MPDTLPPRSARTQIPRPSAAAGAMPPADAPHPTWPAGLAWLIALALAAACVGLACRWRRGALRAWQAFAREIGGAFSAKNRLAPARVVGTVRGRDFLLETALSYEDEAPYYHTRACLPLRNAASFVLGLRHKSLLEEAQTRRDPARLPLDDPDFERQFFVVCNDLEALPAVLTRETRRELARYPDVEVYTRLNEIEWRRAGEERDARTLLRLTHLLADMAEAIDALPPRARTLSERLADEALIEKGV
ncbi:MAG TPA: hypothetical protein VFB21_04440 [Chthonomonadaceae bacterium]|nr:hypothetical protein [Chthonomonadaceae bacterium]